MCVRRSVLSPLRSAPGMRLTRWRLFDKSCSNYQKLTEYFQGLAAFQIENEVDVTDEQDTATDTKLTVNWTLTLTDLGSNSTERRSGDVNIRLLQKDGKWKIVDFSPIDLFNPQQKPGPKRQPAQRSD